MVAGFGLLLFACALLSGQSQPPQGTIQHVIIVIQENRSTTNMFYDDQTLVGNGAHVRGKNNSGIAPCKGQPPVSLIGMPLAEFCFNPDHSHVGPYLGWPNPPTWINQYDNGAMDGACTTYVVCRACKRQSCPAIPGPLPYTYVSNSDGAMTPLYQIAEQYGFANWMFQTNQGPSFEAHEFLFSGTSAPEDDPNDSYPYYHEWFAMESTEGYGTGSSGSTAIASTYALQQGPPPFLYSAENYGFRGDSIEGPLPRAGYPCYHSPTLPTLLDAAGVSWRYYAPNDSIWTAPLTYYDMCQPSQLQKGNGACASDSDYQRFVAPYVGHLGPGQVLKDLGVDGKESTACQLQQVSWVVPDGNWSDHPGSITSSAGPAWVAGIINAVGGYDNSRNK